MAAAHLRLQVRSNFASSFDSVNLKSKSQTETKSSSNSLIHVCFDRWMLEDIHTQLPHLFLFLKCIFGDVLHILWVPLHRKKEPNSCSIFLILLTSQNTYVLWHSSTKPIFQTFIHQIVAFKCHAFQEDMYMWCWMLESNPQPSDCHTATLLTLPSTAPCFLLFCRLGLWKLVCVRAGYRWAD